MALRVNNKNILILEGVRHNLATFILDANSIAQILNGKYTAWPDNTYILLVSSCNNISLEIYALNWHIYCG